MAMQLPVPGTQWSTTLCSCCDDVGLCCITCWCPCMTFGQIAEIVDRGTTPCGASGALYGLACCLYGCEWLYSFPYRSKIRAQYGIEGSCCEDCGTHFCCEPCALCQMHRELTIRGYDMKIGWQANVEKQALLGIPVPPSPHPKMSR